LSAIYNASLVYFNWNNWNEDYCVDISDTSGTGQLDGFGWNVLACNQLAMPISYGSDSMFLQYNFDYDEYTAYC
jgi:hypothetical protein